MQISKTSYNPTPHMYSWLKENILIVENPEDKTLVFFWNHTLWEDP